MKRLIFLLFFPVICRAQSEQVDTMSWVYKGVQPVSGISARVLQSRARVFMAEYFVSLQGVTKLDDRDGGVFIVNGNLPLTIRKYRAKDSSAYGELNFTMKMVFRNGKYKYTLSQINHIGGNGASCAGGYLTNKKPACSYAVMMDIENWIEIKVSGNNEIGGFLQRFTAAMQSDEIDPEKTEFPDGH